MNTCIYYSSYLPSHRLRFYALFITLILIQLITHLNAQTTWTGSVDNTWSNPDNWSNGVPGTTPGSGSVVVIGGNDLADNTAITLDGTYYLNSLSIAADDYQTSLKEFFSNGTEGSKIVFEAIDGVGPTLSYGQLPASGATERNLAIGADIEIADDLSIIRTTQPGSLTYYRRMQLNGIISGDGKLSLDSPSTSNGARIEFNNHNTFTGDIDMLRGYYSLRYSDSLGASGKNISVGSTGNLITVDLTSTDITGDVDYSFNISNLTTTSENGLFLIQAGSVQRQLVLAGDFTGSENHTVSQTALHLIAQGNQQMVFTGNNSTFGGRVIVRYGSEIVLAGANAQGVAWENADIISLGRAITSSISGTGHTSALLLRGDYTLNAPIDFADSTSDARDRTSIGQVNHEGDSYNASFNGNIRMYEKDYRSLNLVSEDGGSATFSGTITVAGNQGMDINNYVNVGTSNPDIGYYESTRTGTVVIGGAARVASALGGTVSIGTADIRSGTLIVNTQDFYADVMVREGARLGGFGKINGNVTVLNGGVIEAGFGTVSPTFTSSLGMMSVTGDVNLNAGSSIIFQVNGASINVGDLTIEEIATYYGSSLESVAGDHDYLDIIGDLNATDEKSLKMAETSYQFAVGDIFRFIDFASLNLTGTAADYASLWDLPDLSHIDPAMKWSFDLLDEYGVLVVIVPEPGRILLIGIAMGCFILKRRRPQRGRVQLA